VTSKELWLIADREGALAVPRAFWFPELEGLRWRDVVRPRGFPLPPGLSPDQLVIPKDRWFLVPVWREPTRVPDKSLENVRRWIDGAGEWLRNGQKYKEPWPGVYPASPSDIALFRAGKFRGGQPDPSAPAALAATAVAEAGARKVPAGVTTEEALALGLREALQIHALHDFPPKIGGAYTRELLAAFDVARDAVRPASKRPTLREPETESFGGLPPRPAEKTGRFGLGDPTDRIAELAEALLLEREKREWDGWDGFRELLRRLVIRAITAKADARVLDKVHGLAEKAAWERIALLVVAVEREPSLYGDPRAAARKAWGSERVGLNRRARRKPSA